VASRASYTMSRYLRAKKSVDNRARNRVVWGRFLDELVSGLSSDENRIRILELGGGIGRTVWTVVDALVDRSVRSLYYECVDQDGELLTEARTFLEMKADAHGFHVVSDDEKVVCTAPGVDITVRFVQADVHQRMRDLPRSFDAVIAQSMIDLTNPSELTRQASSLVQDGILYFPLHTNDKTTFLPVYTEEIDRKIEHLYHASMDRMTPHGPTGGSSTGQQLVEIASEGASTSVLEIGASDWVVCPNESGGYKNDENYFLRHILTFVEDELGRSRKIDRDTFTKWTATRRKQVERGELIFLAHHLDVLIRSRATNSTG